MAEFLGRTWCEVLLDNVVYNYHVFERLAKGAKVMCIIKADAYGHADVPVARALYKEGCRHFGVAALGEAIALRKAGIEGEILVLGHTRPELAPKMAELSITQTLVSAGYAQELSKALANTDKRLKCHIKADTGMSRVGLICYDSHFEDAVAQASAILDNPKLEVTGIFTHFCVADEPKNPVSVDFTKLQHSRYMRFCKALEDKGYCLGTKHCSNSGAILHYPDYNHDMIRPGIALYGLYEEACNEELKPCLRWLTTVSRVKETDPGQTLSYGRTYTCQKPMKVASLSIGYADGLARMLSNKGRVLINGAVCPHSWAHLHGPVHSGCYRDCRCKARRHRGADWQTGAKRDYHARNGAGCADHHQRNHLPYFQARAPRNNAKRQSVAGGALPKGYGIECKKRLAGRMRLFLGPSGFGRLFVMLYAPEKKSRAGRVAPFGVGALLLNTQSLAMKDKAVCLQKEKL